ncbi:MAG: hypothetical protein KBD78_04460 [Oligoflexales bacterium]|nr:hypothetical protein [Oligoflexales bacterium]
MNLFLVSRNFLSCKRTLSIIYLIITSACSKSPSQYQKQLPPAVQAALTLSSQAIPNNATNPNGGKTTGRSEREDAETAAARTRENSSKPIILGEGAAGITFNTTLQESRELLSEELIIAKVDPFELHVYPEYIAVQWDKVSTQKPEMIIVYSGYQGLLNLPEADANAEIRMGTELSKYFTKEDPSAYEFFNRLYRHANGLAANSDENCFSTSVCRELASPEARSIIYMLGSSVAIAVSDDERKALSLVLLTSDYPLLNFRDPNKLPNDTYLTTEIDLVTGNLTDSDIDTHMELGNTYGKLPEILVPSEKLLPRIGPEAFYLSYRGGALSYTRSSLSKDYLIPKSEEILEAIIVTPAGNDAHDIGITLSGKSYVMRSSGLVEPKRPRYTLAEGEPMPLPVGTKFNSEGFDKDRNVKTNFVSSISEAVNIAMQKSLDERGLFGSNIVMLPATSSGRYSYDPTTQFWGQTGYIDTDTMRGLVFEVMTSYNDITVIYSVSQINNPFDGSLLLERSQDFDFQNDTLLGYSIGEYVEIKNIDRAINEATLTTKFGSKRITFNPKLSLKKMTVVADTGKVVESVVHVDEASMSGLSLYLKHDKDDSYQIVSISGAGLSSKIKNLCQTSNEFTSNAALETEATSGTSLDDLQFGMSQTTFLKILDAENDPTCAYYTLIHPDAVMKNDVFYFPHKQVKVVFSNRELSSVTVY